MSFFGISLKHSNMTEIKNKIGFAAIIADKIREQGFIVVLLLIFGYWMSMKNDACNELRGEQYERQMELLQTIIKDNTRALDQNSQALRMIQPK